MCSALMPFNNAIIIYACVLYFSHMYSITTMWFLRKQEYT